MSHPPVTAHTNTLVLMITIVRFQEETAEVAMANTKLVPVCPAIPGKDTMVSVRPTATVLTNIHANTTTPLRFPAAKVQHVAANTKNAVVGKVILGMPPQAPVTHNKAVVLITNTPAHLTLTTILSVV